MNTKLISWQKFGIVKTLIMKYGTDPKILMEYQTQGELLKHIFPNYQERKMNFELDDFDMFMNSLQFLIDKNDSQTNFYKNLINEIREQELKIRKKYKNISYEEFMEIKLHIIPFLFQRAQAAEKIINRYYK